MFSIVFFLDPWFFPHLLISSWQPENYHFFSWADSPGKLHYHVYFVRYFRYQVLIPQKGMVRCEVPWIIFQLIVAVPKLRVQPQSCCLFRSSGNTFELGVIPRNCGFCGEQEMEHIGISWDASCMTRERIHLAEPNWDQFKVGIIFNSIAMGEGLFGPSSVMNSSKINNVRVRTSIFWG